MEAPKIENNNSAYAHFPYLLERQHRWSWDAKIATEIGGRCIYYNYFDEVFGERAFPA